MQAARLTMVQLLINSKGLQMNPLQSLYYVSPACLICLTIPFGARPSTSTALLDDRFFCPHHGIPPAYCVLALGCSSL